MSESIHQEVVLNASPSRIYEAYMDSDEHSAFTGGAAAQITSEEGGSFMCHGGGIVGRNVELVPGKRIVQAWRSTNWEEGVYSMVSIGLEPEGNGTRLTLDHTGFPDGAKEMLEGGWHERYWKPMGEYLK